MLKHFLDEESDRLLRFGSVRPNVAGVFNQPDRESQIACHPHRRFHRWLVETPRDEKRAPRRNAGGIRRFGEPDRANWASAGCSSAPTSLCRNNDVDTLYMHCLSSNKTMMHIAKKAGMEIHRDYGEADAYLKCRRPRASVRGGAVPSWVVDGPANRSAAARR
jgi:hypothetical protein